MPNDIANNMTDTIHQLEEDRIMLNTQLTDLQLAYNEQMLELKEAKRLLKAAVEDFETIESNLEYDEHCVIKTHSIRCGECPFSAETIYRCKWRYADEALKLIEAD